MAGERSLADDDAVVAHRAGDPIESPDHGTNAGFIDLTHRDQKVAVVHPMVRCVLLSMTGYRNSRAVFVDNPLRQFVREAHLLWFG